MHAVSCVHVHGHVDIHQNTHAFLSPQRTARVQIVREIVASWLRAVPRDV